MVRLRARYIDVGAGVVATQAQDKLHRDWYGRGSSKWSIFLTIARLLWPTVVRPFTEASPVALYIREYTLWINKYNYKKNKKKIYIREIFPLSRTWLKEYVIKRKRKQKKNESACHEVKFSGSQRTPLSSLEDRTRYCNCCCW